jgi:hypothetical protein
MLETISLEDLVLSYCRQAGGLVEPPAYSVYEVLLPDEIAAHLGITPHQRFAFTPEAENATYLYFNHPLVEAIVEELHRQTANGRFFINNLRLEKPGLYEVIEKVISLPNAKMFLPMNASPKVSLHHYVRFNFKVSLVADEKRELILPVWMDMQGGHFVNGEAIEAEVFFDQENGFPMLPDASLLWTDEKPLSFGALAGLLGRARLSVPLALGDTLSSLQKRLQRYLELDRARLNSYYDDLRRDTERRWQRAEEDRRAALESKLVAIDAERGLKILDVEQKYHLTIQLELINLAVITQPKLDLMVEIRKRGVSIQRRATWDPLLHTVAGLVCDVCNHPGHTLMLCENGHLAHTECLTPQCVECKRIFCIKCADQVQTCAVCGRPICVHSLSHCSKCGKVTCKDDVGKCHSTAGQSVTILREQSAGDLPVQNDVTLAPTRVTAPLKEKTARRKPVWLGEAQTTHPAAIKPRSETAGGYLEVYADPAENEISAYVIDKKREVAVRVWWMSDEGIAVSCRCDKTNCSKNSVVYRPADGDNLKAQLTTFIEDFAREYSVALKKIRYFHVRQGQPFSETKLKVPAHWKNPATLEQARAGFEALKRKNWEKNFR